MNAHGEADDPAAPHQCRPAAIGRVGPAPTSTGGSGNCGSEVPSEQVARQHRGVGDDPRRDWHVRHRRRRRRNAGGRFRVHHRVSRKGRVGAESLADGEVAAHCAERWW